MNSIFSQWEYVALIALAGGVTSIFLRSALRGLVGWLDIRLMPMRYLKKCGVRRRETESMTQRLQEDA